MEASPVKLFSKSFSSIKQTDSTLIFETLKSVSCQETETVYIDEVLDLLKSICEGFAKPKIVENIVYHYAREAGILSEISYFNEREFKELMNRLIDEWFEAVDRDGDGLITKKDFYRSLKDSSSWSIIIKRSINKTFDNFVRVSETSDSISKQHFKMILRKIAVGEEPISEVVVIPSIFRM